MESIDQIIAALAGEGSSLDNCFNLQMEDFLKAVIKRVN